MKSRAVFVALLAGAIGGCQSEGNVGPDRADPSLAAKGTNRPMSGRCSTSYTVSNPSPTGLEADHVGTCTLTHLGRATLVKHEVVDFTGPLPVVHGNGTLTAADGDRLELAESAELSGLDPNGGFTFTGTWTFSGGTGRFQHASGQADFTGSGSAATNTTERTLSGRISY